MKSLAVALISNKAILDYDSEEFTTHEEVIEIGKKRAETVEKLISEGKASYKTCLHSTTTT